MNEFIEAFSNKEVAIIFWLAIVILVFIIKNPKQIFDILKLLFSKILLPFYLIFIIYFICIIGQLQIIDIWNIALYKDFIFWFFTSAVVSFFKVNDIKNWIDLNKLILHVFSWNMIMEFLIGFYNFSLIIEFVLVPIITILCLLFAFASAYKERPGYGLVINFLNIILNLLGLSLIVYVLSQHILHYDRIINVSTLKSFLFTPVFTLLFSPFIVLTVFYIKYENIFSILNSYKFLNKQRKIKIKFAFIKYANFNFNYIKNAHDLLLWRKGDLQDNRNIDKYIKMTIKKDINKQATEF